MQFLVIGSRNSHTNCDDTEMLNIYMNTVQFYWHHQI